MRAHCRENLIVYKFLQGVVLVREQYVSLDSYIRGCLCCLNTHMCHKSKCSNDIYLVALSMKVARHRQKIIFCVTLRFKVYFEPLKSYNYHFTC